MTRGERRMRRNRPRAYAVLGVVAVAAAAIAGGATDPWIDPAARSALTSASLLAAWVAGSLVAGSRRRRT